MDDVKTVIKKAPAKINLGLRVLRKRSDGFHDVQTVFVALTWCDRIILRESDQIYMTCSDPLLPTDGENLCIRAAQSLAGAAGIDSGVLIHLEKHIPWGAGLGGGSSDAAATLTGLAALWDLSITKAELRVIALTLGSDVAFFLDPRPALGEGRGERLTYLGLETKMQSELARFTVAVAAPRIHISTKDAYSRVVPRDDRSEDWLDSIVSGLIPTWPDRLLNDFEDVVFREHPELQRIKTLFYERGALYASMSGSGSSVFGLFDDSVSAENALGASNHPGWVGRLLL